MKKATPFIIFLVCSLFFASCEYFQPTDSPQNVARVNDAFLTQKEIEKIIPKNLSEDDSIIFTQNYINRWATRQLLLEGAKLNLPQKIQDEYDKMVNDYRQELYAEAYKDIIVANKMDTTISNRAIETYYEEHRTNFTLKEDLAKLRFIQVAKDYADKDKIIEQFKRYNKEDREEIADDSFKFVTYSLMDSVWVSAESLKKRIPPLQSEEESDYLEKEKYIERSDSLSLYLIYVKDVRLRNEQAPLSYARPTVKQILLNKRKLQFAKEFEKDITKDALENDTFEIYK